MECFAKRYCEQNEGVFTSTGITVFSIIIRVHSGFSLVENYDLLEDRRTLAPFQRRAIHSNFRIIDSQWRALFCIDHDHAKWRAKVFSSHYKAYFGKIFLILLYKANR